MPEFVKIFSGFLTPLIAIIVAYIAYQQWKTNKYKLNLELFDRIFKVYQALIDLFVHVFTEGDVSNKALSNYRTHKDKTYFLFDKEMSSFLDEVYTKAKELKSINILLKQIPPSVSEESAKKGSEALDIVKWMNERFKETKDKFEKYLRLK